jgi:hypothetical protein
MKLSTKHLVAKATLSHNGEGSAQPFFSCPITSPLQVDTSTPNLSDTGKVQVFQLAGLIPAEATKLEVMLKDVVNQFYNTKVNVTIRIVLC